MAPPSFYRYRFRDGRLIKVDLDGNPIEDAPSSWSIKSFPLMDDPHSSPHLASDSRVESSTSSSEFTAPTTTSSAQDTNIYVAQNTNVAESVASSDALDDDEAEVDDVTLDQTDVAQLPSPSKISYSSEELLKRDREAIQYTKSLLVDGDTLVYINFPGNIKPIDSTGFELSDQPHQVHSELLLATGSSIFADLLGPTKQFRTIRRKKLVNKLPNGIKYVLDLTPPDEGDEAVELTAELSCSLGIRMWYTAEYRCNVSSNLVGGSDPTLPSQRKQSQSDQYEVVNHQQQVNDSSGDDDTPIVPKGFPPEKQLEEAIKRSKTDRRRSKDAPAPEREVLEYCPIRHRIGISDLLRAIEGKDVRIDSAPKLWTLFVLAKNFECESKVQDIIVTWMIAHPNSQFIEILPEKSFEIGCGLKLSLITRVAFSILVSEEALSLVAPARGLSIDAGQQNTTTFGRRREDLNEDLKRPIEYASKVFAERIAKTFNDLIDPRVSWLYQLPEFSKLYRFEQEIYKCSEFDKRTEWLSAAFELVNLLRHFIRGRILSVVIASLTKEAEDKANDHRTAEHYFPSKVESLSFGVKYDLMSMKERIFTVYFWEALRNVGFDVNCPTNLLLDSLTDYATEIAKEHKVVKITRSELFNSSRRVDDAVLEAIMTGHFAGGVIPPEAYPRGSYPLSALKENIPGGKDDDSDLEAQVWDSSTWTVKEKQEYWADTADIAKSSSSSKAELPVRAKLPSHIGSAAGALLKKFNADFHAYSKPSASEKSLYEAQLASVRDSTPSAGSGSSTEPSAEKVPASTSAAQGLGTPRVPIDSNIDAASPFFSLAECLHQINWHIRGICSSMLDTKDFPIDISITDTILCLRPEEFKYLPLWAGGDDDDSGGVFDPSIPAAAAGPSGPGPSFHTGLSNTSSRTASEFGEGRSSVNTSLGVEDGFSVDHVDRRRVIADDDMHSETFSEDSELYDRKGKGVDRGDFSTYRGPPSVTASSATIEGDGSDYQDAASVVASSVTMDGDLISFDDISDAPPSSETMDIDLMTFSDTETETGFDADNTEDGDSVMGGADDDAEDVFADVQEEPFDFGDDGSDEDMVIV